MLPWHLLTQLPLLIDLYHVLLILSLKYLFKLVYSVSIVLPYCKA